MTLTQPHRRSGTQRSTVNTKQLIIQVAEQNYSVIKEKYRLLYAVRVRVSPTTIESLRTTTDFSARLQRNHNPLLTIVWAQLQQ